MDETLFISTSTSISLYFCLGGLGRWASGCFCWCFVLCCFFLLFFLFLTPGMVSSFLFGCVSKCSHPLELLLLSLTLDWFIVHYGRNLQYILICEMSVIWHSVVYFYIFLTWLWITEWNTCTGYNFYQSTWYNFMPLTKHALRTKMIIKSKIAGSFL